MPTNSRILYVSRDTPFPAGGVRTIYHHVSHLVKNGFPAFIVHTKPGFRPSWFEPDIPILYLQGDFTVYPEDIIVIPEDHRAALKAFKDINVRKLIFCQNHFYVFQGIQSDETWEDYGISGIFCSSTIISDFISTVFGYADVPVVPYAIPLDVFKPLNKKLQIAYMPRKRGFEIDFIKPFFNKISGAYRNVPWVSIDDLNEREVADILGESAIFLSTSQYEGFGLPPIEAMACGCIVVGYHGYGGLDYARNNNGFWCEEGNVIECAWTLTKALELLEKNEDQISILQEQALETANQYNFKRQERELLDFWNRFSRNF